MAIAQPIVLVVDDDTEVRQMLALALAPRGLRVVHAESAAEGLERLREALPAVIVLDYWLPHADGRTFVAQMDRIVERRPPLILCTAVPAREVAAELGAEYVEKPFDLRAFVTRIDALVRGPAPVGGERRAWPRFPYRRAVEVRTTGARTWVPATTLDVSEGGLGLEVELALARGAYLGIAVVLEDGRRVELDGRVRHATGRCVGLQFFAVSTSSRKALLKLLAEAQR